jgi:hypothetical protein
MPNERRICRIFILKKKKGRFSAVKYRSETYYLTQKLNREDYGVDKYWVKKKFSRLRFEINRPRLRFLPG